MPRRRCRHHFAGYVPGVGATIATCFVSAAGSGFLSEAVADATPLPASIPLVGGQPVSILLPGGQGNCAAGDDRDVYRAVTGWWFYFEWSGDRVAYTGP